MSHWHMCFANHSCCDYRILTNNHPSPTAKCHKNAGNWPVRTRTISPVTAIAKSNHFPDITVLSKNRLTVWHVRWEFTVVRREPDSCLTKCQTMGQIFSEEEYCMSDHNVSLWSCQIFFRQYWYRHFERKACSPFTSNGERAFVLWNTCEIPCP